MFQKRIGDRSESNFGSDIQLAKKDQVIIPGHMLWFLPCCFLDSSDASFWANYAGGHKCLPVNTTGGTQVSSWSNYRVGHFEILSPYFPCHA